MPFLLSPLMSCIVSLVATIKSIGLSPELLYTWLGAWGISWMVAFPVVLVVLPVVRRLALLLVEGPSR
ncbi:DUF2798 domain-containing protein [Rheinheimera sp.]|uniref:DUF2798 domain-containing protein n=1 Tax=Rheinheimera sp. TaxID=1869214 RepID=UPI003AF8D93A